MEELEGSGYAPRRLAQLVHRLTMASAVSSSATARRLMLGGSELSALEHLASGELTPTQLADRLGLSTGTVTALLDRLEHAGHLERHPNPQDRRSLLLKPTQSARDNARAAIGPLAADIQAAAERLSATDRATIGQFLEEVIAALERHAAGGG